MGVIVIGDSIRPQVPHALQELQAVGIRSIIVLSGDNQGTVNALSRTLGIAEARGELLPEAKALAVQKLGHEHGLTAMIGDGVNDAPAMATASLAIAMGGTGTDVALETADVTLMNDDLDRVAEAILLARRTLGIIRFNIAFALGLKALFLLLTVCGYASLWLAIIADTGATLLVVANGLRLLRSR
jgi:Cd2+/Zn2+-exporting ATPase